MTAMKTLFFLLFTFVSIACSSSPSQSEEPEMPGTPNTPDNTVKPSNPTPDNNLPACPGGFATLTQVPTGGQGGKTQVVTTLAELISALKSSEPLIIYVKGEITFTSMQKVLAQNKTLIGLKGSKLVSTQRTEVDSSGKSTTGILYIQNGSSNLILRNLTFESAGAYDCDGNDNLCIDGTTRIWVDHCDFQDGVDGNFDCKNASDEITVSWCRFHYLKEPLAGGPGGSDDHRFTNLWGSSQNNTQDRGHLRTTFYGCWWDEGCRERMPRVRFGQVHIVNCLYSSSVTNYCIGAGYEASVLVERTVFSGIPEKKYIYKSITEKDSNGVERSGIVELKDCAFLNSPTAESLGTTFTPAYNLTTLPVSEVEAKVRAEAGATLDVEEP